MKIEMLSTTMRTWFIVLRGNCTYPTTILDTVYCRDCAQQLRTILQHRTDVSMDEQISGVVCVRTLCRENT